MSRRPGPAARRTCGPSTTGVAGSPGSGLTRFRFVSGAFYDRSDVPDFTPSLVDGYAQSPRPSVDPVNNRLIVTFVRDGHPRVLVYSLADAVADRLDTAHRLVEVHVPECGCAELQDPARGRPRER